MGNQDLDIEVLNAIKYLTINNLKVSYRNIARQIGKINSIRSVQLSINRLIDEGDVGKGNEGKISIRDKNLSSNIKTRKIPLIGNIACGGPMLAEEYVEDHISIAESLLNSRSNYFLLRTSGDSMNSYKKPINPGDVILVKQQNTAENGDIVVALIDDEATLKEFRIGDSFVKLIPHSTNPKNKTIIVTDIIIQGIFVINLGKI